MLSFLSASGKEKTFKFSWIRAINRRPRLTTPSLFINSGMLKETTHNSPSVTGVFV